MAQRPVTPEGPKQPRILILLDGSSSMLQPWNGSDTNRFRAAAGLITQLMDSMYAVNAGVEFGLRVYGEDYPAQDNNCYDTRLEVMFSKDNRTQMQLRLAALQPRGVSPIAFALKEAAENDLENELRNAYSIILLTDGGESCNGNICEVVEKLVKLKIFFKPYIISMLDYAPLKQQYACLGTYLQVTKPADAPVAVKAIIDEYRPLLTSPQVAVAPQPAALAAPTILPGESVIRIPKWIPQKTTVAYLPVAVALPRYPVRYSTARAMQRLPVPKVYFPPAPRVAVDTTAKPAPVAVIAPPILPPARPVQVLRPEAIAPLPARVQLRGYPVRYGTAAPKRVRVPTIYFPVQPRIATTDTAPGPRVAVVPMPKRDSTVVTITKLPAVKTNPPAKPPPANTAPPETPASIERTPAPETMVSVFFTNGSGRFYTTTPRIQFINKATGAVVSDYFRQVNEAGEPKPEKIPAGMYRLVVKGKTKDVTRDVEVKDKMMNRIVIKVSNGSLKFYYTTAPNRPVAEYEALVNRRFAPGPVIRQRATAELEYDPGNYYIEINTLPISRRNTDIDFGAETAIGIPEPGQLQIINADALGSVQIFYPLGDAWANCANIQVSGDAAAQKLVMLPGTFEARWRRNGAIKVQRFEVKSNSLTQIELE